MTIHKTKMFVFKLNNCCLFFIIFNFKICSYIATPDGLNSPEILPIFLNNSNIDNQKLENLPKVGKCCLIGQGLFRDNNGVVKCDNLNSTDYSIFLFTPVFSNFNKSGLLVPGKIMKRFITFIGNPCQYKRYMLEPEILSDDEHYLLRNGSIFAPNHLPSMLFPGIDYCMEIVPEFGPENFLRTLVCAHKEDETNIADFRLTFYACGLLISVPFLILTIIAYCITPRLMDVHGKSVCHYCGCLIIAFLSLAFVQLTSNYLSDDFCISAAFVIQFSFIACFFWLNVMSIETYQLAKRYMANGYSAPYEPKRLFFYYSLWAWIPPAVLIIISMIMDLSPTVPISYVKPNFGSQSCWFESHTDAMPYFYIPIGLLLSANVVLFILTAIAITRHQRDLDLRRLRQMNRESNRHERMTLRRLKRLFLVCLSLFFLMGINWTMEVISWWVTDPNSDPAPLAWSAFDLINALQGVLIFGIFVLRKPIRQLVWYQIKKLFDIDAIEPEVASKDRSLLNVLNIDAVHASN